MKMFLPLLLCIYQKQEVNYSATPPPHNPIAGCVKTTLTSQRLLARTNNTQPPPEIFVIRSFQRFIQQQASRGALQDIRRFPEI